MEEIKNLIENRLKKNLNSKGELTELEVADITYRYVTILGEIERYKERAN